MYAVTRPRTEAAPPRSGLDGVRVHNSALIGSEGSALPVIERALDYAIAALCAEAVGGHDGDHEATLEYLKTPQAIRPAN